MTFLLAALVVVLAGQGGPNYQHYEIESLQKYDSHYLFYWTIHSNTGVEYINKIVIETPSCFLTEAGRWSQEDDDWHPNLYIWGYGGRHFWNHEGAEWYPKDNHADGHELNIYVLTLFPRNHAPGVIWINDMPYAAEIPICNLHDIFLPLLEMP